MALCGTQLMAKKFCHSESLQSGYLCKQLLVEPDAGDNPGRCNCGSGRSRNCFRRLKRRLHGLTETLGREVHLERLITVGFDLESQLAYMERISNEASKGVRRTANRTEHPVRSNRLQCDLSVIDRISILVCHFQVHLSQPVGLFGCDSLEGHLRWSQRCASEGSSPRSPAIDDPSTSATRRC